MNMLTQIFQILRLQNPPKVFSRVLALENHLLHRLYQKIKHIKEMPLFMQNYIKRIVNVEGDDNCGFWAVSSLLYKGEYDYQFFCRHLI